MKQKSIFKSKIFYAGLIMIVAGVFAIIGKQYEFGITNIITGVYTIISRKDFTNTKIK